jgi:hypothetical protein
MHLMLSLSTLFYPYTLLGLGLNNCLVRLRLVAASCNYRWLLKYFSYGMDDILKITKC